MGNNVTVTAGATDLFIKTFTLFFKIENQKNLITNGSFNLFLVWRVREDVESSTTEYDTPSQQ